MPDNVLSSFRHAPQSFESHPVHIPNSPGAVRGIPHSLKCLAIGITTATGVGAVTGIAAVTVEVAVDMTVVATAAVVTAPSAFPYWSATFRMMPGAEE